MAEAANINKEQKKVWQLIREIKTCLMVTQDSSGKFYARPMVAQQEEFDGELWFFTHKNSPKMQELEYNSHVLLSYSKPEQNDYVSVNGNARIVYDHDKIHKYWHEVLRAWFPEGENDPNIALICVTVEEAEYWDNPNNIFVHMYSYAKEMLTGEHEDIGENRKVSF